MKSINTGHNTEHRLMREMLKQYRRRCKIGRNRRTLLIFVTLVIALSWTMYSIFFKDNYITIENVNFPSVGDFHCPGSVEEGACVIAADNFRALKSLGIRSCDAFVECKGFITNQGAKTVTLKNDFHGPGDIAAAFVMFVKKRHASLIDYQRIFTTCANTENPDTKIDFPSKNNRCKIPNLNAFDDTIMGAMVVPPLLKCPGRQNLTMYKDGKLRMNSGASQVDWKVIKRKPGDGSSFIYSSYGTLTRDNPVVDINEDMVRVDVTESDGETVQTDFYAEISAKPEVLKRVQKTGMPVNVVAIGFDSTSHSQFQRKAGKVYKYLKDDPNTFIFNGFSVVGDGTTPTLLGMLTGKREDELPEGRYRVSGAAKCLDDWPWIFKDFQKAGFSTVYTEDDITVGAFTYRLTGFCNPPIDHYILPYWYAAAEDSSQYSSQHVLSDHCIGSQAIHNISFDLARSLFQAYPDTKTFSLTFLSDISHNDINGLSLVEDDLYNLLMDLKHQGYLKNTIFILFGDHGIRFGPLRSTVIGKIEERLPFLSITVPETFGKTYPDYVQSLRNNLNVLTSPFDLHATFKHILAHPSLPEDTSYGKSLFTDVGDRMCHECGILDHFCPCLEWKPVNKDHKHIRNSAEEIIRYINDLIRKENLDDKCATLNVQSIPSAAKVMPNDNVQTYEKAADIDGRIVFKGTRPKGVCSYQIQVVTSPNNGTFEATVQVTSSKITVNPQMSRIDRYGDQPKCIMESHHHMREFCYCDKTNR